MINKIFRGFIRLSKTSYAEPTLKLTKCKDIVHFGLYFPDEEVLS